LYPLIFPPLLSHDQLASHSHGKAPSHRNSFRSSRRANPHPPRQPRQPVSHSPPAPIPYPPNAIPVAWAPPPPHGRGMPPMMPTPGAIPAWNGAVWPGWYHHPAATAIPPNHTHPPHAQTHAPAPAHAHVPTHPHVPTMTPTPAIYGTSPHANVMMTNPATATMYATPQPAPRKQMQSHARHAHGPSNRGRRRSYGGRGIRYPPY